MWILFSLFGAFFQAGEMAIKKKALQVKGINSSIAFLAFTFSGIILGLIFFMQTGSLWTEINNVAFFWKGMAWLVLVNVIAVYFLYKALDIADLSYLMPYMTLTSLTLIIPPIFIFGEIPSAFGILGITMIVIGAIVIERAKTQNHLQKKNNRKGLWFFLIAAACYTFGPTGQAIIVRESSVLFASYLSYLLIGLSFFPLIFIFREMKNLKKVMLGSEKNGIIFAIALAGVAIAAQNASINAALATQEVSYVFGIKRIMPLFAFLIGYLYFKEKDNLRIKIIATSLMVAGAVVITVFGR